jgi:hypothetical protein
MAEPLSASVPINPAGGVDQRPQPNPSATAVAPRHDGSSGGSANAAPSTEFHLGPTVEAVLRAPGATSTLPAGTRFILRIVAMPATPSSDLLIGRVIDSGGPETLVAAPLGLLAVQRRLAFAPGTAIAFERLEEIPPELVADDTPSRAGGWPALDEALRVLTQSVPELAAQLRAELMPLSGAHLAGTLLFLLGALYEGEWPGSVIATALRAADHEKLAHRLNDDVDELRSFGADAVTGDWRVLTLPLLLGITVQPLRLFIRRQKAEAAAEDEVTRFAVEIELSQLGPLQLDGLLRGTHLILVLRSHRGLAQDLRSEALAVCRRALDRWGLTGDLSFATVAEFPLAPLSNLRKHIQISA